MSKTGAKAMRARKAASNPQPIIPRVWPAPAPSHVPAGNTVKVPASQLAMLLQLIGGALGIDTGDEALMKEILAANSITIMIGERAFARLEVQR